MPSFKGSSSTGANMQLRLLLLVSVISTLSYALPHMVFGRHKEGFVWRDRKQPIEKASMTGEDKFNQTVDHFSNNSGNWTQRYFYNQENDNSNINILYIEGEGTATLSSIVGKTNPFVGYAQQFQAAMYALEHRFYGNSWPTTDISLKSLQLLTSRQAIEDLATFIKYINNRYYDEGQKWIVVGGSYAGSLALWLRLLHPELVMGALGSSGPVLAQVDFYGYLQVVEDDIVKYDARQQDHTKPKCSDAIGAAFDHAIALVQSKDGRDILDGKFHTYPEFSKVTDIDENVQSLFYQGLIGPFMSAAQYGGLGYPTIDQLCSLMTDTQQGDPLDRLAVVVGPYEIGMNYTEQVESLKYDQWDVAHFDQANERAWTWQTCNEFGYYQSTDKGSGIFRSTVPMNFYINWCQDVFGIDIKQIKKNIDATNAFYGERNYYKGTNVIITHGTQDPWHWLTKQDSQHESVVISTIRDGIHCRDFYSPCIGGVCNDDVNVTQALTLLNFGNWLNQYEQAPNSINITDHVGERPTKYIPFQGPPTLTSWTTSTSAMKRGKRSVEETEGDRTRTWNVFTGRSNEGLLRPPVVEERDWPANITQGYITSPWDHFDNTNPRVFKQQFFANEKYGSVNGPNFLMIGGEGPESAAWVMNDNLAWVQYAKTVGANLYLLEHRYYGKSKLGTNDLKYLSSAQMLYDVAHFIHIVNKEKNATEPWITFGGSYSGALSAWAREWFPELIFGAVGSSGPVEAKNDFFEYLMVVEKVLRNSSATCADRTEAAFKSLQQLVLNPEGRMTISEKFNLSPPWNTTDPVPQEDIFEVFSSFYGYFQNVVQYSDDNNAAGNSQTVSQLCGIMTSKNYTDPLDALKAVMVWEGSGEHEINSAFSEDIAYYQSLLKCVNGSCSDVSDGTLAGILWTWQTCNEFGYYQTTDYGKGIFGNPVPLNFFVKMCEQVFGSSMASIETAIGDSIYQYGGRRRYKGTNVVLPNGNHDPWHALGLLDATGLDPTVVPIIIEGTAHCADMYPPRPSDPASLIIARSQILSHIQKWITQFYPTTTLPTTTTSTTTTTAAATTVVTTKPTVPTVPTVPTTTSNITKPPPPTTQQSTKPPTTITDHPETTTKSTSDSFQFFSAVAIAALMALALH